MPDSPPATVIDVDATNFEREVVQRSLDVPVVVDFTATWCEPCKTLGPILEREANARAGALVLAKIDIDASPELANALRVQSVPTVLALKEGKLVDGFQGAIPEAEIVRFLDTLAGPAAAAEDPSAAAQALAEGGDPAAAADLLANHVEDEPEDHEARLALARYLFASGDVVAASANLDALEGPVAESDDARALAAQLSHAADAGDVDEARAAAASAPDDPAARLAFGRALVAAGRHDEGLAELLESVEIDPAHDGGAAKQAMLDVFQLLGADHALANDFRYKLSLVLFA